MKLKKNSGLLGAVRSRLLFFLCNGYETCRRRIPKWKYRAVGKIRIFLKNTSEFMTDMGYTGAVFSSVKDLKPPDHLAVAHEVMTRMWMWGYLAGSDALVDKKYRDDPKDIEYQFSRIYFAHSAKKWTIENDRPEIVDFPLLSSVARLCKRDNIKSFIEAVNFRALFDVFRKQGKIILKRGKTKPD